MFHDDKDGMLGLRVAHFLESATAKPWRCCATRTVSQRRLLLLLLGASGRLPHQRRQGRRRCLGYAREVVRTLHGTSADGKAETIAVFDHAGNPNYPTYWHARDYGLFAVNPLGAHGFEPKGPALNFTLDPGKSATFHYRVLLISGTVSVDALNHQSNALPIKRSDEDDASQLSRHCILRRGCIRCAHPRLRADARHRSG